MFVKPNRRRGQGGKFPSAVPVCETGFDDWCPPRLPSWEGGGGVRPGEGRCRCAVVVWPAEIYRCAGKAVVGWGLSGECQGHRPDVEAFKQGGWGRELTQNAQWPRSV